MRTIVTCILRLLVDKSEPRAMRGSVQPVGESKSRPFTDGQGLLELLRQMAEQVPESESDERWKSGDPNAVLHDSTRTLK